MKRFKETITKPSKFKLFALSKLPLALITGLKIEELTATNAAVSVRYSYVTKNPFRSMYFAVQAMAAELSTGLLVMDKVQQSKPKKISMLVLNMRADFSKKAIGKITFTCNDGHQLDGIFSELDKNEGKTVELKAIGKNEANEIVSTFYFTWTLKEK